MNSLLDSLAGPWWLLLFAVLLLLGGLIRGRLTRRARSPVRGLNYLLNEAPDTDLDALVAGLEINDATLDAHLALGTLLRRRGEIDRAIRLHQGLVAGPRLRSDSRSRVELELARDYLAAGLLNRAESLLTGLVKQGTMREAALEQLLEVHQRERDWSAAAEIARQLPEHGRTLAHYLCELADGAAQAADFGRARGYLTDALQRDGGCVRASMLLGNLELDAGRYREAITAFKRIPQQDPRLLPEVLPQLRSAHEQLGSERDLLRFLQSALDAHPSAAIAAELAQRHLRAGDPQRARRLLLDTLSRQPSLQGMQVLLEHQLPDLDEGDQTTEVLLALHEASGRLLAGVDRYRCQRCDFSGPVLHWQCPGCKAWGSTVPADAEISR